MPLLPAISDIVFIFLCGEEEKNKGVFEQRKLKYHLVLPLMRGKHDASELYIYLDSCIVHPSDARDNRIYDRDCAYESFSLNLFVVVFGKPGMNL